eukprot:9518279-Prorocentrum_lima.AAC.2
MGISPSELVAAGTAGPSKATRAGSPSVGSASVSVASSSCRSAVVLASHPPSRRPCRHSVGEPFGGPRIRRWVVLLRVPPVVAAVTAPPVWERPTDSPDSHFSSCLLYTSDAADDM